MASIRRIAYDTGKRREDAHRASSDCRLLLFRRGPGRCRQKRLPLRVTDKTARFGDYGCQYGHRRKSPDQSDDQKTSAKPSVETPPRNLYRSPCRNPCRSSGNAIIEGALSKQPSTSLSERKPTARCDQTSQAARLPRCMTGSCSTSRQPPCA